MHSLEEAQDIARHIIERDVRINSNDELALPKEKTAGTAHLVLPPRPDACRRAALLTPR